MRYNGRKITIDDSIGNAVAAIRSTAWKRTECSGIDDKAKIMTSEPAGTKTVANNWTIGAEEKFLQAMLPWLQKHLSRREKARNVLVLMRNCGNSVQTVVLSYIPGWSMPY
jgi:hypothetical protein